MKQRNTAYKNKKTGLFIMKGRLWMIYLLLLSDKNFAKE